MSTVAAFVEARLAEEPADSPWYESVRWIVGLYRASIDRDTWMREATGAAPLVLATAAYLETVRAVALRWDTHPDFDPAWRPRGLTEGRRPPDHQG